MLRGAFGEAWPFSSRLLERPKSQQEALHKMTTATTIRVGQEKYLRMILEGGCVKTTFDEKSSKFEFKYISKIDRI